MDEIATITEAKELLYTSWLAILLIIVLMLFKWRLGLYGIINKALDWIMKHTRLEITVISRN